MRTLTGREFARLIERHGWTLLRINGSHHVCGTPGSIGSLSIPIHGNRPLKTGLQRHLTKLANLPEDELP